MRRRDALAQGKTSLLLEIKKEILEIVACARDCDVQGIVFEDTGRGTFAVKYQGRTLEVSAHPEEDLLLANVAVNDRDGEGCRKTTSLLLKLREDYTPVIVLDALPITVEALAQKLMGPFLFPELFEKRGG